MIKVIITDDHPVVRKGIKQIFDECQDIVVVDEAENGSELISKIHKIYFDVLLLDISLPGRSGLDLIKDIKEIRPDIPILILSISPEEQYAVRALKLGASGYITKASLPDELISAVRYVAGGKTYMSSNLKESVEVQNLGKHYQPLFQNLSERELEVLCMIAEGKTVGDIALRLCLSVKTISTYRERILEKLCLKTTAEIIRYAIKEGLVN
jgi:two-component system, NarL family, invasion response regulator UvrY